MRAERIVAASSLLIAGLGIGWLTGLSASPVVGGVIASIMGIAAGITAVARVFRPQPTSESAADPLAAAVLILGIALGAPLGVVVRSHRLLEPKATPTTSASTQSGAYQGVLFGKRIQDCDKLHALVQSGEREAFRGEFRNSSAARKALSDRVDDFDTLRLALEAVCESE